MNYRTLLFIHLLILCAQQPALAQDVKMQSGELVPVHQISFNKNAAVLTKEGELALIEISAYLQDKTAITTVRIEGHVAEGADKQGLSEARAIAVSKWLIKQGVDCTRLIAVGFGNTKPVGSSGDTRIVLAVAGLRGHLIGGMPADGGGNVAGDPCK